MVCCFVVIILIIVTETFSIDVKWFYLLLLLAAGDLPFICATWEEYHIGFLYLGIVNGPIEGVLSIVFSQLIGAVFSHSVFAWKPLGSVWPGCPPFHLICIGGTVLLACVNSLLNVKKVIMTKRAIKPVGELVPFVFFIAFAILGFLINTKSMNTIPLVLILGLAFQFGYLASNITLSHLLKRPIPNMLNIRYVILFFLQLCGVFGGVWGLAFYCVTTALLYFNFAFSVCHTIASYLRINVLTITPPGQARQAPVKPVTEH